MNTVEIDDDEGIKLEGMADPEVVEIDDPLEDEPKDEPEAKPVKKDKTDDDEDYSRKVQKRIDKLVAERNIERQRAQELQERLERIENRFAEADNAYEQRTISDRIAALRRQKVEAMEIGEFDRVADIDDEIMELRTMPRPAQQQRQQPVQQQAPELPEAQQAWLAENDWFYNPAKAQLKEKASQAYLKLVQEEGFDPNEPETYAELDKRLNVKRTQAAPPPAGVNRGGATNSGNTGAKFTAEDARFMRDWGLDPNDATARAEFLKQKRGRQ